MRAAWRRLALAAAAAVLAVVLAAGGWVAAEGGVAPGEAAAGGEVDAVVALVGSPGRLAPAERLAARTGATLAISERTPESEHYGVGERRERCAHADGEGVVCFTAAPYATRGEARAVGELAAERGWDRLAVVTSRYHLRRAGLLVRQCVGDEVEVALVAADGSLWPDKVLREVVALGPAVTVHRAC